MRIAYFTNQYPALSHTFIRREIRAIGAMGKTVFRYALRPGANLVDCEDREEETRTRYILRSGALEIIRCNAAVLFTRPLAVCQAIALTIKIGWRSDRGILRHFVYVIQAAVLACWCRRDRIDHVHAHFGTNSVAIAMLASRLSGIPYSFTVHGPEEFDKAQSLGLAEKIRHCLFVVAISSYGRSQLYRCIESKQWKKVQVVHCGLEPAFFQAANNASSLAKRFVCVGRLDRQKGHLLLVEAAHQLATRGEDFELVLVGEGEMRADIEAQIRRYQLQAKICITGSVDGRQVRDEISAARALVLASFAEGLPVVIMEAMALKRPVIATFIAGIPELVHSGEHGWLVPAGDAEALADAMQACLHASAEVLECMGEAARKRVLQRHNAETEAAKLVDLFDAALSEKSFSV